MYPTTIPESFSHKSELPLKLYRYVSTEATYCASEITSLESVRDNILQGRIWFSSINKLNDPFEGRLLKSNYKDELDNTFEMNNIKTAVCCFSETKNNMAMWAHYAAIGKGICLEYETDHPGFLTAKPINYISSLDEVLNEGFHSKLLRKSRDWSYEKEWRIFSGTEGYSKPNTYKVSAIYALDVINTNNLNFLSWPTGQEISFFVWDQKRPNIDLTLNFEKYN